MGAHLVITLSIDRTGLSLADLVITDDTGDFVLMPGFTVGGQSPENTYAESSWLDGGLLTGTRLALTAVDGIVRVAGTDAAGMLANIEELTAAVQQFSFTAATIEGASTTTYDCSPASVRRLFNRFEMRQHRDLVAITIPRQP